MSESPTTPVADDTVATPASQPDASASAPTTPGPGDVVVAEDPGGQMTSTGESIVEVDISDEDFEAAQTIHTDVVLNVLKGCAEAIHLLANQSELLVKFTSL